MGIPILIWPIVFPIVVYGTSLGIIIYLIIRRIKEKKKETFEDRDN